MPTWVIIKSEPGLWTVGFFTPDDRWEPHSDHSDIREAEEQAHYLNGGCPPQTKKTVDPIDPRWDERWVLTDDIPLIQPGEN